MQLEIVNSKSLEDFFCRALADIDEIGAGRTFGIDNL